MLGKTTWIIVACCGCYAIIAMGYISSLIAGFSFPFALFSIGCLNALWIYYCNAGAPTLDKATLGANGRAAIIGAAVTAAFCLLMPQHGAADAWLQWNSLAKYMSSTENFRYLHLRNSLLHASYPPGLTGPIGLGWRMLGCDTEMLPRAVGFLFYGCIVLVLCEAAARVRQMPYLWMVVLSVFVICTECVHQGLLQYADVPLSLFTLLAVMLLEAYRQCRETRWLLAAGLMLGGCVLLKNEGLMIAGCFLAAYAPILVRGKGIWLLSAGFLPALAILVMYKQYVLQGSDLIHSFSASAMSGFTEPARYVLIFRTAISVTGVQFLPLHIAIGLAVWLLYRCRCGIAAPNMLVGLCLCVAGYLAVYLSTGYNVRWLVGTTANRLYMQLLPTLILLLLVSLQKVKQITSQSRIAQ